jgi:hypothetical protein
MVVNIYGWAKLNNYLYIQEVIHHAKIRIINKCTL